MTGQEIKEALLQRFPVKLGDLRFDYVSAVLYRCKDGRSIDVSAELMESAAQSVTIAGIEKIERAE